MLVMNISYSLKNMFWMLDKRAYFNIYCICIGYESLMVDIYKLFP